MLPNTALSLWKSPCIKCLHFFYFWGTECSHFRLSRHSMLYNSSPLHIQREESQKEQPSSTCSTHPLPSSHKNPTKRDKSWQEAMNSLHAEYRKQRFLSTMFNHIHTIFNYINDPPNDRQTLNLWKWHHTVFLILFPCFWLRLTHL